MVNNIDLYVAPEFILYVAPGFILYVAPEFILYVAPEFILYVAPEFIRGISRQLKKYQDFSPFFYPLLPPLQDLG